MQELDTEAWACVHGLAGGRSSGKDGRDGCGVGGM